MNGGISRKLIASFNSSSSSAVNQLSAFVTQSSVVSRFIFILIFVLIKFGFQVLKKAKMVLLRLGIRSYIFVIWVQPEGKWYQLCCSLKRSKNKKGEKTQNSSQLAVFLTCLFNFLGGFSLCSDTLQGLFKSACFPTSVYFTIHVPAQDMFTSLVCCFSTCMWM